MVPDSLNGNRNTRLNITKTARLYILDRTQGFRTVCALAGVDEEAVHDRVKRLIKAAPSPEELILGKARKQRFRKAKAERGVVSDFASQTGTGGGTAEQDSPQMKFSKDAA